MHYVQLCRQRPPNRNSRSINAAHGFSLDQQISGCTEAIQSHRWQGRDIAWAFNNRGFAYYLKRYLDPAFEDFEQAIRLDAKDAAAFNNRGLVYQARGDVDRAIADYNEAIRLDPTYIFAYNNRGGAYRDKNDYDRAIADYSDAIRLDPKFAVAFNVRGNAYGAKREFDRAIADYDQMIKLNPKYAPAFYNRFFTGELALQRGSKDEAAGLFRLAAADCGKNTHVWVHSNAELKALGA